MRPEILGHDATGGRCALCLIESDRFGIEGRDDLALFEACCLSHEIIACELGSKAGATARIRQSEELPNRRPSC